MKRTDATSAMPIRVIMPPPLTPKANNIDAVVDCWSHSQVAIWVSIAEASSQIKKAAFDSAEHEATGWQSQSR
jgi:hypothetical protein